MTDEAALSLPAPADAPLKCNSSHCKNLATVTVCWVSGPIRTCAACAERWQGIGAARGMQVVVIGG